MKRITVFIAILVCVVAFCSCNNTTKTDKICDKPPVLTVKYGDEQINALLGTHTWNWTDIDGTVQGVASDHAHPLNIKEHVPVINTNEREAVLHFEDAPDTVSVVCWSDDCWNNASADSEEIVVTNNSFELKQGGFIYQIMAKWNDKTKHNGEATYSFYAVLK